MNDQEYKARKALEKNARERLSKMKQRMRKPNLAEAELLGVWFAYENLGNSIDFKIDGDNILVKCSTVFGPARHYNLRTNMGDLTSYLRGVFNQIAAAAEVEALEAGEKSSMDGELDYWRNEFTKRKAPSFEKISSTWGDMTLLVVWLAENGGQG